MAQPMPGETGSPVTFAFGWEAFRRSPRCCKPDRHTSMPLGALPGKAVWAV